MIKLKLIIEFIASIAVCHFMCIIFGAPFIESFFSTLAFSVLISLLALMPIFFLLPHDNAFDLILRLLIEREYKNHLEYKLVCVSYFTIIGSWLGALVIPLDWDVWWQQWPLSCAFGAIISFLIGSLYSFTYKKGTRATV